MKKLTIISAIALSGLMINTANAQIRVSLGFGFAPRPVVYERPAPVAEEPVYQDQGYQEPAYDNSNDDYYYLPDVDAYYSVDQQCYYYNDGDNWVSAAYLPGDFGDYDWRYAPHYEVRAMRPYLHNDFYREHYNGHFIGDWNHNVYRERNNGGYLAGRFHGDNRFFSNTNHEGFGQRPDNRDNNRFGGQNYRPEFNGQNNRPVNQERGGNAGYNRPTENNHGPQFNQGNRQERGSFGGGEQHFASFNQRGGEAHRGRF